MTTSTNRNSSLSASRPVPDNSKITNFTDLSSQALCPVTDDVSTISTGPYGQTNLCERSSVESSQVVSNHEIAGCFLEALPENIQLEVVTCIIDSGAGLSTISEELARRKGLVLNPSPNMARLGDGSIVKSRGVTDVSFIFGDPTVLSDQCRMSLDAMGFNKSILISRHLLSKWKFRFFDSCDEDFGSWLITPSWRWYKLRIEGGATVCDFQISTERGNLMLQPITNLPDMHLDLTQALDGLTRVIPDVPSSETRVLHGAAASVYSYYADAIDAEHSKLTSHLYHVCVMSPCCLVQDNKIFDCAPIVAHGLRRFTKQELHEVFGHVSDECLNMLLNKPSATLPKLTKSQKKNAKCRCPSCLRGHHPARRVRRHVKRADKNSAYADGESWNWDYGRYWMNGDIEGFKTDVTFVERNTRYAYAVLLKDHTCLWDAVQELRRFVREKCGVEVIHLYCDSDPNVRVNGAPSETYTALRQKLSDAGIDCEFSPPHQHALNSWVENFRGRALHIQNSMLQHAHLSSQFRGRAYLHAVYTLNCLPVPGSDHHPLKTGECPWNLLRRKPPDYSLFVAPWGASVMVKNIGTRASQLESCSEYGILMNMSNDCAAWEIYIPDKQKFVTSTHIVVDSDMSKRLASLEKYDLILRKSTHMSHTAKIYADGIRNLFNSTGTISDDLMVQRDPLSGMPVKLVSFVDDANNDFIMTADAVDSMTSNFSQLNPDDSDNDSGDALPQSHDDVGQAFIHLSDLPANRSFPLPKAHHLTPQERKALRDASDHVILDFNKVNPKTVNPKTGPSKSYNRYQKYSSCCTLGEFRRGGFKMDDLYFDMARGYVRVANPPNKDTESHSSFFPAASMTTIPHISLLQHYERYVENDH